MTTDNAEAIRIGRAPLGTSHLQRDPPDGDRQCHTIRGASSGAIYPAHLARLNPRVQAHVAARGRAAPFVGR
jgi:hypothetical protein